MVGVFLLLQGIFEVHEEALRVVKKVKSNRTFFDVKVLHGSLHRFVELEDLLIFLTFLDYLGLVNSDVFVFIFLEQSVDIFKLMARQIEVV